MMIKKQDYTYDLPEHLIAQHPLKRRDQSRLMVLDGDTGSIAHHVFQDLPDLLSPGDCLVVNNSRVIPARLLGVRADSRTPVEVLLLHRLSDSDWEAIVRPGRRIRPGHHLVFIPGVLEADVLSVKADGNRIVRFIYQGLWEHVLDQAGTMPLPPYIHEKLSDPERYQTIYARHEGSAAAPTAGLHFTEDVFRRLDQRGITVAELTLHVGLGTFRPVKTDNMLDHQMHAEYFELSAETAAVIESCRHKGGRVVAVGTTSCRVLETVAAADSRIKPASGWTDIYIYPGHTFRAVDLLVTNFHLPESTLIMLVSALAGREHVLAAYSEAIRQAYRFFSFGDAMLVSRRGKGVSQP